MTTKAELIEAFRQANEDLTQANVRNIYKAKYGTASLIVGSNVITLPLDSDTAYATADEYEIRFLEAIDGDDIDIREALSISAKTSSSFTVTSPRAGSLRWETFLKVPNFNFHT